MNISRRIHAATCSDVIFMDIPWSRYLANLHEYWIKRLSSPTDFRAAEVTIHFPGRSIVHYSICLLHLPRCRILTPAMPTQTWPRRAPPAGTAAAKKTYTKETLKASPKRCKFPAMCRAFNLRTLNADSLPSWHWVGSEPGTLLSCCINPMHIATQLSHADSGKCASTPGQQDNPFASRKSQQT